MLAVYYSLSVSYIYLLKFIQFVKNYTMPNILFIARKCNITMKMKKNLNELVWCGRQFLGEREGPNGSITGKFNAILAL